MTYPTRKQKMKVEIGNATLYLGDCMETMRSMADDSVDSIVTDPPYGLSFMGKKWDYDVPSVEIWAECLRVLKPGGHLLAFAGTRTQHRMAVRIEDAGFEIRDMIAWVYGSGFPKSLDVSKAIDKARNEDLQPAADVAKWLCQQMTRRGVSRANVSAHFEAANIAQQWTTHWRDGAVKPRVPTVEQWAELRAWLKLPSDMDAEVWRLNGRKGKPGDAFAEREVVKEDRRTRNGTSWETTSGMLASGEQNFDITAPATEAAKQWDGWGTALKPALEPITVARKPFKGTVAANVLAHGTGAINVDGCRVGTEDALSFGSRELGDGIKYGKCKPTTEGMQNPQGRWPANLIHDGSPEVLAGFPQTVGAVGMTKHASGTNAVYGDYTRTEKSLGGAGIPDKGSAARFFYCAKASKKDRDEGCEGLEEKHVRRDDGQPYGMNTNTHRPDGSERNPVPPRANNHPTVKPTDLMRYLVRLVTPPGGVVLDPFMGSGSTGKAAILEGFSFVGCELSPEYLKIASARIEAAQDKNHDPDNQILLDLG